MAEFQAARRVVMRELGQYFAVPVPVVPLMPPWVLPAAISLAHVIFFALWFSGVIR